MRDKVIYNLGLNFPLYSSKRLQPRVAMDSWWKQTQYYAVNRHNTMQ